MTGLLGWPPTEDWVEPAFIATSKRHVFRHIARRLAANGVPVDPKEVCRAFLSREHHASTAVGRGIAVPEARIPADEPSLVLFTVVLAHPVPWGAPDGRPTRLVFATVGGMGAPCPGDLPRAFLALKRILLAADYEIVLGATTRAELVAALSRKW